MTVASERMRAVVAAPARLQATVAGEPSTADVAVRRLLEAACGYARREGKHQCRLDGRRTSGCDAIGWAALRAEIEAVVRGLVAGDG